MTSEHQIMSSLESRIVDVFRNSFLFSSRLKLKGLVAVTADESATIFVDVDKIIPRDDRGNLEVGPRNALQQWKKSQNSEQLSWQNQWLQQQQQQQRLSRMSGEVRSIRASGQSPSQRFRMSQMPTRVRMPAPQMQSPRMSSLRMQHHVPQSVVRLKKIPSHLNALQSVAMAAFSAAKSLPTQERFAIAGHNEREVDGATRDCFLPPVTELTASSNQMHNSAHSVGVAQLYGQAPFPTVANNNKRKIVNMHDLLESSNGPTGDSKEPWKRIPKLPSRQKTKRTIKEHSEEGQEEEEEEMKEVEENKDCKSHRSRVGNGDSKEALKKMPKLPSEQKATKALKNQFEERQEDAEMREIEENRIWKRLRPKVVNVDSKEAWKTISKMPRGQNTKKVLVEQRGEEEEVEEKRRNNGKPKRTLMIKEIPASLQTATQDMEALGVELPTSKAAPRKRTKIVEHVDEAKMPKLEKVEDDTSFWNTFVSKGKKKAVTKQAKS